jgi:predicted dehydrogenase
VRAAAEAGVEVVGIANHRLETARAFAGRHGIGLVTEDWAALATDARVAAVCVCTPNALHAAQAMAALEASKHVLIEKPMAMGTAEADAMLAAAERSGRVLLPGHMWRYRAEVRRLRERIAADELGRIVRTHGWGVHAGWGPSGWFTDPLLAGGGALIDMGIHAVDTAAFLLGDPAAVRVQASLGVGFQDGDVDGDGLVLIDWDAGARSLVESAWWAPHAGGLEADTVVYGRGGWARIWPRDAPPGHEHGSLPMYVAQMADFAARCLDPSHTPPAGAPTGATGRAAVAVVEEAYRQAARPSSA